MKLSEYAKIHSVTYRTAWNRFKKGKIKNAFQDESGTISILDGLDSVDFSQCALYCRVSSNKQKNDLDRQSERVKQFAIANGYTVNHIIKEVGSGINDNRKRLIELLQKKIGIL